MTIDASQSKEAVVKDCENILSMRFGKDDSSCLITLLAIKKLKTF